MNQFGIVRIGVAVPRVHVANPAANLAEAIPLCRQAEELGCDILLFPELSLTGYTCGDLFHQSTLIRAADEAGRRLLDLTAGEPDGRPLFSGMLVVGAPVEANGRLYNAAAVIQRGELLGLIAKRHLPNYKEFYEARWFQPAPSTAGDVRFGGRSACLSFAQRIIARDQPDFQVAIEICEDLWVPNPPSGEAAQAGATVLLNLSASNETVAKSEYRRQLVLGQSARCLAAYAYAGSGPTESTTDLVFGGHAMIAECGVMIAESKRFRRDSALTVADIDLERIRADRHRVGTFHERPVGNDAGSSTSAAGLFRRGDAPKPEPLRRRVAGRPFVPDDPATLADRCEEITEIQIAGLAKRLETIGVRAEVGSPPPLALGVSGGLDSTLALLVTVQTLDRLGVNRRVLHGISMPGFGTSGRTRGNAERLMELAGIGREVIDIRSQCLDTFRALGHQPFGIDLAGLDLDGFQARLAALPDHRRHDLTFENVQARQRTLLLMSRGFTIGTGDMSELALGWATYNADHMSMYNPNVSIPKTLVRCLIRDAAERRFDGELRKVLLDIADTPISPELLPIGADGRIQSTEDSVGPYELHDFFLHGLLRFGFGPAKLLFLARHAEFRGSYSAEVVHHWLRVFLKRFFANQFKRSCLPDGPKVGSVTLSPRGDWRMPSDADVAAWLEELHRA
jgi:NAD+ synthase (glutamine-hydrolysing)